MPKPKKIIITEQMVSDALGEAGAAFSVDVNGILNVSAKDKDRKSTRLNSSHTSVSRMPSSA